MIRERRVLLPHADHQRAHGEVQADEAQDLMCESSYTHQRRGAVFERPVPGYVFRGVCKEMAGGP